LLVVRQFQPAASSPHTLSSSAERPHGFLEVISDHFDAACDLIHMAHERAELNKHPDYYRRDAQMLAEKFFLLLETLKSRTYPDGSPRVLSSSPHVPVKLPSAK
jgi:hypothetical protein